MHAAKTVLLTVVAFVLGIAAAVLYFRGRGEHQAGAVSRPEIILYSEPDFQGRELHLYDSSVDLPFEELDDGSIALWNDNIGSIVVVSGTWRFYQHGRWNTLLDDTPIERLDVARMPCVIGWSSVLSATSRGPLRVASLELAGLGPDMSSVELVAVENLPDWICEARRR
jgi:hypothetical protein